ncbi:MAG: hypothetical protein AB7L09_02555 [Nitrospira sp.]
MSWDSYDESTRPMVRTDANGNLFLDDPTARGMISAVGKHNCRGVFDAQRDRVEHFVRRITDRGDDPNEVCIVLLNVDDPNGAAIAEMLMPGFDWQEIRDRGEVPFARGLAARSGLQDVIAIFDIEAAANMAEMVDQIVTVVVDHGVATVFPS